MSAEEGAPLLLCADTVHTMTGGDDDAVTAVLVRDGRVAALGTREELGAEAGPEVEVVDLGEGCITPGLVDAHIHPIYGLELARGANLSAVTSLEELLAALREEAARAPEGWVLGYRLDPGFVAGRNLTAADIDAAVPDRPAVVRMFDAHSAVVNSVALDLCGITGRETFPSAARVDVDDDGAPTGFLIEWQAMDLALDRVPPPALEDRARGLLDLLGAMADSGLAGGQVLDYTPGMLEVLEAAEAQTDLPIRLMMSPWIQAGDTEERVAEVIALQGRSGRRWSISGAKLMIDGTIDNGSAWLERPDVNGESTGPLWLDPEDYTRVLHRLSGLGIRTTTHAIGDAGVRHVIEAIAAAPNPAGVTHRVEHIETAPDETLTFFAEHGIAASMQPTHCTLYCCADHSDNWSQRLGDERVDRAWRLRSLRDLGVTVAMGSDWPVAPFEPLRIMADAQLRREAGQPTQDPIVPAEALTARQALEGYTTHRADSFDDAEHGRIRVGGQADLTLLAADVLTTSPDELPEVRVVGTVVDGVLRRA